MKHVPKVEQKKRGTFTPHFATRNKRRLMTVLKVVTKFLRHLTREKEQ